MIYSTRTALVIRADLCLVDRHVAAFLSGGLAGTYPEIVATATAGFTRR